MRTSCWAGPNPKSPVVEQADVVALLAPSQKSPRRRSTDDFRLDLDAAKASR